MKYFTKEVQIALVAVVGLVVLFFGLQFLKGVNLTSSDTRYYAQFDDMSGLSANCPVYADGYKVGIVKEIIFNYGGDNSRTVDVHIKRLREKLEGASDQWSLETIWRIGYKFQTKDS